MSNNNYNNDLLKSLDIYEKNGGFYPTNYPGTNSAIRYETNNDKITTKYILLKSINNADHCPKCGCINGVKSKGLRTIFLNHVCNGHTKTVLEIMYRRYKCFNCNHNFKDEIPLKFYDTRLTYTLAQSAILSLKENTAMAVIARSKAISKSTIYRIFYNHVHFHHRNYNLSSVISIDEFRATSDEGAFAFNIVNPITGKALDIIGDRKADSLRKYFLGFSHTERNKVKIIIMDLSGPFKAIMSSLFPNAKIIADKFHYVRNVSDNLTQARIQFCKSMFNTDESLARLIKRNLHLFDQYKVKLNDEYERYHAYFKKHLTNKQLLQHIFELDICQDFKENYDIYQNFLKIVHQVSNNYKDDLNKWLEHILNSNNKYYIITAKNFRKNWFLPILRSLTYKARYIRNGEIYTTSFNNGCIESLNNKFKLVKRNAYGYRYFQNLRKRILLHLGFTFKYI